jgi:ComF family protein
VPGTCLVRARYVLGGTIDDVADGSLLTALLDGIFPPMCPGCGLEGAVLCGRCRGPLERRMDEPPGVPIGLVAPLPDGIAQLEWCASFSGPVREALHALKYRGERRLAAPLGEAIARRWSQAGVGGDLLVPVPIHPERLRSRGYDQAVLLARAAGARLGLPVAPALRRTVATAAQHRLGREGRAANVGRAFAIEAGWADTIRGRWVVIVDDIVTTGATLSGCAVPLLEAGATAVAGLAVARER